MGRPVETVDGKATRSFQNWRHQLLGFAAFVGCVLTGGISQAQQNLFNVPSAEITDAYTMFFQEQMNFASQSQCNTTIDYGLGNGFEVGVNILNLNMIPMAGSQDSPNTPLAMLNAQKGFRLGENFLVGVGTQIGEKTAGIIHDVRLADFTWMTVAMELPDKRGRLYAGPCYTNVVYGGVPAEPLGYMLGYDIPVVEGKFNLMGDYISGTGYNSVAVLGAVFRLGKCWQLSLGGQLPSPHSNNSYGGVIEFTYVECKPEGKLYP